MAKESTLDFVLREFTVVPTKSSYNVETLRAIADKFLDRMRSAGGLSAARERLYRLISIHQFDTFAGSEELQEHQTFRMRDCATALKFMLKESSDRFAGFSVAKALYDIARDVPRPDLQPGFYAEMIHLFLGLQGVVSDMVFENTYFDTNLEGRKAAIARSELLDRYWEEKIEVQIHKYRHGLQEDIIKLRSVNRARILSALGGSEEDWYDWRWQLRNIVRDADSLAKLVNITEDDYEAITQAKKNRIPFGITPYYVSLMDETPGRNDTAVRAQVIPSPDYVKVMSEAKGKSICSFDFMLEKDTSPIDLITRRYPSIVILKPYNTCPQICVYCQRNWEIEDVLAKGAMAAKESIEAAIEWIKDHPAIHDVLVTGGDPLALNENVLKRILDKLSEVSSIERIRIGSRTPVTMPMRITPELVNLLASYRIPMKREITVVTHVEHPYEITEDMFNAVELLRKNAISVYNQNVYTFYVSRRFEGVLLRRLLKRVGIEPYYTFNAKGKEETADFRVPIARLLQEQKEEARLLPGLSRTDEAVYNVPGLGKNYLRAFQHRDILSILPDGSRVYNFHPWEKNISIQKTYVGTDVPILEYLNRLESIGEDIADYETIWYYF